MRVLALAAVLGGCSIEHSLLPCGELLCPRGTSCTPSGCVEQESATACAQLDDGDGCTTSTIDDGTCAGGACHPVACGNGIRDRGEACDDGNQLHADGCSADCRSDETCGNGIADVLVGEECDVGVPAISSDGCTSTCLDEIETWRYVEPTGVAPRSQPAMTYDSDRNVLVLFGGFDARMGVYGDTWEWDTINWLRRTPGRSPSPRSGAAMAYDPVRRRTVLFGGTGGGTRYAETWLWDGIAWTQAFPATSPTARAGARVAWDPVRERVVLLGGSDATMNLGDTWEWDGTTWSLGATTSVFAGRGSVGVAYDYARDKLVAQCGQADVGMHDWTGSAWTPVAGSAANRDQLVLASDPVNERIVMFGGTVSASYMNDSFVWQGTSWSSFSQSSVPPGRAQHVLAFHAGLGQFVTFGGVNSGGRLSDTWVLTANAGWEERLDAHPAPRRGALAIYDPLRGNTLLSGGINLGCFTPRNDQWLWDGFTWKRLPAPAMPARFGHAGAFDAARGVIVAYGGVIGCLERDDTWLWNGTTWTSTSPTTRPARRAGHGMAYDAARGVVVMFGGAGTHPTAGTREIYGDTWTWNGTDWTQLTPATAPVPRERFTMAYDPLRQRVVLHGGQVDSDYAQDTWEWDGATWSEVATTGPSLIDAAMTYDPMRGVIVMVGGLGPGATPSDETWEWDGVTWRPGTPLDRPAGRSETAIAYDAIRRRLVMFGGSPGFALLDVDTWARSFESVTTPREPCLRADEDADGDGLVGCDDPDCFGRCTPLCPPGGVCPPTEPHCGDGSCGPVEDYVICPTDCTAP